MPPRSCPNVQENYLQAQAVTPSIFLRYLSAHRLEFGFNSCRQFKGHVSLLQVKSAMIIFCRFASRIAKQSVLICIIIVYVSKFPTLILALVLTCFTSPLFSRINFVCFAFCESVKIQLALSKAACFPISVSSYLAFELILLGNQNGLLQKTNNSAWRKGNECNDICMGIRKPSRVHCLTAFFFGNLYPLGK